ncbi:MAG: hypothetical protein HY674_22330 [Chloroflexi bacterium]|nr:hypothetical protein [Chloroflexota bacterium]
MSRPENLKVLNKNGDRIVIAAFYGNNRPPEYLEYHRKVFAHFGLPINHVLADFSRCTHGSAVDGFLKAVDAAYDYFVLFDTDAVPLRSDFIDMAYDKTRDKRTVFGAAQQSNHIYVNNTVNHIYAGPCAFAISREMYVGLGRPTFSNTRRSDTAEEITWRAEEAGYSVCCVFPSHVTEKRWQLGNGHHFGIGTTYGDCVFHAFVPTDEKSKTLFIQTCEEILVRTQPATSA